MIQDLIRQPASMADIHAITEITEGLDESIRQLRASQMSSTDIEQAVKNGMVAGIAELMRDEATIKAFWKSGYEELAGQAQNNATQWVGKRVLTAISAAVFVGLLVWSVKTGHLK